MRRILVLAVMAVFSVAALAYAQQVNTYKVTASTLPTSAGSKTKPVPIQLKFNYEVSEQSGNRPSPVKRYKIAFKGIRSNGKLFRTCLAATINDAKSDAACPSGSLVGTGSVRNNAGATSNPADKSIPCNLSLKVYNSGDQKAALYLKGAPPTCAVSITQAIAAKFVATPGGTALQFDVPPGLLHPIPGIDNAVVQVESTIRRVTKKVSGKTRGFFESIGGCTNGKRNVSVQFTPEVGSPKSASTLINCKS